MRQLWATRESNSQSPLDLLDSEAETTTQKDSQNPPSLYPTRAAISSMLALRVLRRFQFVEPGRRRLRGALLSDPLFNFLTFTNLFSRTAAVLLQQL
jgi:hypothetical protein